MSTLKASELDSRLLTLVQKWDGVVSLRHDRPTNSWMFVAIHSNTLGRPTGGVRMKIYPNPLEALQDAMKLAEAMTSKWACVGMPKGGGKAVLAVQPCLFDDERHGLLWRFGAFLGALQGSFAAGPDLGTTQADMAVIGQRTRWVHGIDHDPGPFTADGVLCGIEAALGHRYGQRRPEGRKILIQGLGSVGEPLARRLAEAKADLILADTDRSKAQVLARELGCQALWRPDVTDTPCEVYAPCALGGTLNAETIPHLRCDIVAGSANNQLADDEDAERLAERDILYVPDFVLNAGGAMAVCLLEQGVTRQDVRHRLIGLGTTVSEILDQARADHTTPLVAAYRRADEALRAGRGDS